MTNGAILDRIDSALDEVDRLIQQLTIPNKKNSGTASL